MAMKKQPGRAGADWAAQDQAKQTIVEKGVKSFGYFFLTNALPTRSVSLGEQPFFTIFASLSFRFQIVDWTEVHYVQTLR